MYETYEQYNRANSSMMRSYAEDCADELPLLAKYCVELDKAYNQFRHVALSNPLQEGRDFYDACDKFSSLKKYALFEWEKNVAICVQQIKKWGNDRDKAKLRENMYWIRGTIRSVDELFNKIRLDKNGNEIKIEVEKNDVC